MRIRAYLVVQIEYDINRATEEIGMPQRIEWERVQAPGDNPRYLADALQTLVRGVADDAAAGLDHYVTYRADGTAKETGCPPPTQRGKTTP